jgi:transmembrane sensor
MKKMLNNQYSNENGINPLDIEQKILMRSERFKVPETTSKEEALSRLKLKIEDKTYQLPQHDSRTLVWLISSAATILLLVGIWRIWIFNPDTKIIAENGTHFEYNLPDGSQVSLNADSRIVFETKSFTENRKLKLDGEAFFNVMKGNPFVISTKNAEIKVLGTSFNVFSRNGFFKVSCLTGKVMVSNKREAVVVLAGESVMLSDNDLISYQDKNQNSSFAWMNGEFNFENTPLNLIFDEIARQFNVKFEGRKIDNKYFTGSFTNKNLVNALEIVCIPMDLSYEIGSSGKILISERKE